MAGLIGQGSNEVEAAIEAINPDEGYQHVSPNSVRFERRVGYVVFTIIFLVILAGSAPFVLIYAWSVWWVLALAALGWLMLAALLFWLAHFWPPLSYRCLTWRLDDSGLEIRRGVLWKHRIAIPAARVQHVDVSQGPVQRMFQLGKLTVYTAGTSNASIELDGLDYQQAMELRDRLIEQKEAIDVL